MESAEKGLVRVQEEGAPKLDDGDQIQKAVEAKYVGFVQTAKDLKAEAEAIPLDSPDTFSPAVVAYSEKVALLSREIAASLTQLESFDGYSKLKRSLSGRD